VSEIVTVIVGHRLGKVEAVRRVKEGLTGTNGQLGGMIAIDQETWQGDTLHFRMRALGQTALATIEVLRPMPGIAFAPVALLLFGFSLQMELMVVVLPALWPVLINTMGAVAGVHARLFDVGRTFRLSGAEILRKVMLPAALPGVLVGARLSLTLALVLAVVAEMVGNPAGLGYAVVREQQAMRPDLLFAYVVAIGALGVGLNAALTGAVAWLFPAAAGRLREAA